MEGKTGRPKILFVYTLSYFANKKNVVVKSITLLKKKKYSSPDLEVALQVSFGVFEVLLLLSSP